MKDVYIVSAVRTPVGSFLGAFKNIPAPKLAAEAIKEALKRANVSAEEVDEVILGNVLSAGIGQGPARQAAIYAGISPKTPATTINKLCSSGLKSAMFAHQAIVTDYDRIVVAGGMESMSLAPFYLLGIRNGYRLGHTQTVDGMIFDGLWDPYHNFHMGTAADLTAKKYNISREEQDEYAATSYKRAAEAWKSGKFKNEVVPIPIKEKDKEILVTEDEEYKRVDYNKMKTLKPAFNKDGTVTPANASKINDGACAIVLMSEEEVKKRNIKPLARIISYADHEQEPQWFTTAPSQAIPKALKKANLKLEDIDYFEINEAFAVVALVNVKLLGIPLEKVNVWGGAVALGHPIGCSGARILTTLISVLKDNKARYGVASLCNGGGGATAMVIENIH